MTELRQFGWNSWFTQQPVAMLDLLFVRVDRFRGRGRGSGSLLPVHNLKCSISIPCLHKGDL
jgi:hypothetical protein